MDSIQIQNRLIILLLLIILGILMLVLCGIILILWDRFSTQKPKFQDNNESKKLVYKEENEIVEIPKVTKSSERRPTSEKQKSSSKVDKKIDNTSISGNRSNTKSLDNSNHKGLRLGFEKDEITHYYGKNERFIIKKDGELKIVQETRDTYLVTPTKKEITEKSYVTSALQYCFDVSKEIQGGKQYEVKMVKSPCKIRKSDSSILEKGFLNLSEKK